MAQINLLLRHAKRSNQKVLDLSNKDLSAIPKEIYTMTRTLEQLNLSNNHITTIDPQIKQLLKLKILNLQNNSISELPQEIGHIPFLNTLKLKGNPLDQQFASLADLKFTDNLQDALHKCFQSNQSQIKISVNKKKSQAEQTSSWRFDIKKQEVEPQKQQWNVLGIKQEQPRPQTAGRRPRTKQQGRQYQPQQQSCNGVLVLKVSNLQIGQQISMGGFSTIHRGKYFDLDVAVKKVFNPNISQQLLQQFNNQVNMLAKYRHPNIVLMIGALTKPPQLLLAMQLVKEGTLFDLIHKKKTNLHEGERKRIVQQMVGVIAYLHQHGILHRDIKSHNMLLDRNFNIKLCDFGLAKHKSQLNSGPMQFSGTPTYMAPQLFEKRSYNQAVDVFALGTLLYEVYAGEVPYHGLDPADIKTKVLKDSSLPMKVSVKKSILQLSTYITN